MSNGDLLFAEESTEEPKKATPISKRFWRILIVDDEEEVHLVTKLVLKHLEFDGAQLQLLHAYSGLQAQEILEKESDIALALVDVVMESDDAGLQLIRWIREEQCNNQIRLVLRTGQPGQAPEQSVITDYDINDYKDKTELTNTKLRTLIFATLRSYRDIIAIDRSRAGLERVINATSTIYKSHSLSAFASAVLDQIELLLYGNKETLHAKPKVLNAAHLDPSATEVEFDVIAATGDLFKYCNGAHGQSLPEDIEQGFRQALSEKRSFHSGSSYIGYFSSSRGGEHLMYVNPGDIIDPLERHLLDVYSVNVGIAHDNLKLRDDIQETQRELVYILGEAVEERSKETGAHVQRVALISELLATKYGLPEEDVELAKLAAPLHDVGKIAIPDKILHKPGKLDSDEWEVMKTHAEIGHQMLSKSNKRILQKAAIIAQQHHENWDGSGYPMSLKGEQIDIMGRIAAVADVFDALGSVRCYKPAYDSDEVLRTMQSLSGSKFEPKLVQILLDNKDQFLRFRTLHPDPD